jgi:hypothetical protein
LVLQLVRAHFLPELGMAPCSWWVLVLFNCDLRQNPSARTCDACVCPHSLTHLAAAIRLPAVPHGCRG